MNNKLIIVHKQVGKEPIAMKVEDCIENQEKLIGGKIKIIPFKEILICCNKELQNKKIKLNIAHELSSICGDCFIVGEDKLNGKFKSLTREQVIEYYEYLMKNAFDYSGCDEYGNILSKSERRNRRYQERLNKKSQNENQSNIATTINKNKYKTNENQNVENKEMSNLSNEKKDEEILQMILGIQGTILKFIKTKMTNEYNESEED